MTNEDKSLLVSQTEQNKQRGFNFGSESDPLFKSVIFPENENSKTEDSTTKLQNAGSSSKTTFFETKIADSTNILTQLSNETNNVIPKSPPSNPSIETCKDNINNDRRDDTSSLSLCGFSALLGETITQQPENTTRTSENDDYDENTEGDTLSLLHSFSTVTNYQRQSFGS
jgi:hypothetical protein